MRILRLIPYFADGFGGPVRHVKRLTTELTRMGHETIIYTTNLLNKAGQTTKFHDSGFDVRAFPVRCAVGDYFFAPEMKEALRGERFDVIHAHCYRNYQSDVAAWLSYKTAKPLVLTAHGTLPILPNLRDRTLKGFYDAVTREKALKRSSKVVALSEQEINQYQALGVPRERIARIDHGVDTEMFRPADTGLEFRRKLGLENSRVILCVGRIHERKGLQYLLKAIAQLAGDFPDLRLLICGPDYGYGRKLTALARRLSVDDRVVFLGEVQPHLMPDVYNACDVLALTAQYEVFGQVFAEAAACGKTFIATRWGWVAEFFADGEDCYLIKRYGDVSAIADALRSLLSNPGLGHVMGARAMEKVVRELSWERCARSHDSLYRGLAGLPASG
jgi:glycosyltransferase involved in cell wall biosynthesis